MDSFSGKTDSLALQSMYPGLRSTTHTALQQGLRALFGQPLFSAPHSKKHNPFL